MPAGSKRRGSPVSESNCKIQKIASSTGDNEQAAATNEGETTKKEGKGKNEKGKEESTSTVSIKKTGNGQEVDADKPEVINLIESSEEELFMVDQPQPETKVKSLELTEKKKQILKQIILALPL